jgi:hypothetical protein
VTFRWPTKITDSDDDLNSEITDYTYMQLIDQSQQKQFHKNAFKDDIPLKNQTKIIPENHEKFEHTKKKNNDIPYMEQKTNSKNVDSGNFSDIKEICSTNNVSVTKNNTKCNHCTTSDSSNLNLINTSFVYDIIREDKLRIILSNLKDTNCPLHYLDKFIDCMDFLRYILSYKPSNHYDTDKNVHNLSAPNSVHECENHHTLTSFTNLEEKNLISHSKFQMNNENAKCNQSAKSDKQQNNDSNSLSSELEKESEANKSSSSDTYMGMPKINFSHLIRSRDQLERFKNIKNQRKFRNSNKGKQHPEQIQFDQKKNIQQNNDSFINTEEYELDQCKESCKSKLSSIAAYNVEKRLEVKNIKADHIERGKTILIAFNLVLLISI